MKVISLFFAGCLLCVASVGATPTPTTDVKPGKELYQGAHLPPGLRSRRRAMHRRDIPYGGYLTFGNLPMQTNVPVPRKEEVAAAENSRHGLLGLLDLDLDLHL
ncbi:hypothetical protein H4S07_006667 [Coemansia furcata]|uniref:Uncharacterized protein n=1 Tax=Coemansia furcata TaxID=417177 RepID=A0ACC1KST8_9FUNG|nr:hypothetical protein H4S07_006667 [Coemansia furcata]